MAYYLEFSCDWEHCDALRIAQYFNCRPTMLTLDSRIDVASIARLLT